MNKALKLFAVFLFVEVAFGAAISEHFTMKKGNSEFTWNFYLPADEAPTVSGDQEKSESLRACSTGRSGIYWKSWTGSIPEDAVVGAYTTNEQGVPVTIYMAQAYLRSQKAGLQPVQIFEDSKSVFASHHSIHEITGSIKVLCSEEPESLEWYDYRTASLDEPETNFVIAGYENDYNLYFGRTKRHGRIIIGKVALEDGRVYFPDGDEEGSSGRFEILGYKEH